jgi:hypothetical protein
MTGINKLFPFFVFAISMLYACVKVEMQPAIADKAVVEGYVFADRKIRINISKQIGFNSGDTAVQFIDSLQIILSSNSCSEVMVGLGSGVYESLNLIALENENYSISLSYRDKLVTSKTTIPQKPSGFTMSSSSITISPFTPGSGNPPSHPNPIQLSWNNPNNEYFLIVVESLAINPIAIFDTSQFRPQRRFINNPVQTNYFELNMQSFSYYGSHRVILFSVSPEYAALYDDNGYSSLNLTTPPCNINGGLGIFTGINADTLSLYVNN